jgi:low affinity Fe/Cu permease
VEGGRFVASPAATAGAFAIVIAWALCGPVFHYSDGWQLVINTGTTIITFLMVFILNNAQARDTTAMNAKLDAIIIAGARRQSARRARAEARKRCKGIV